MLSSVTGMSADVHKVPWDLRTDGVTGITFWGFQFAFDKKRKWPPFHRSSSPPPPFCINFLEFFYSFLFFKKKERICPLLRPGVGFYIFQVQIMTEGIQQAFPVTDSFIPDINFVYFCRSSSKLNMDSHAPRGGYSFTLERHSCKSTDTLGEPTA